LEPTFSLDTRAVLLLCVELGRRGGDGPKPLGTRHYNELEAWLQTKGLRPGDLPTSEVRVRLSELQLPALDFERVAPLLERGDALDPVVERWESCDLWVISRNDTYYPQRLKRYLRHSAPPLLYGIGPKDLLNRGGLAVVGSRDCSPEDSDYARRVGAQCAKEEIQLISGGAKGIDKDAMDSALDAGGWVLGVLAEGLAKTATSGQYRSGLMNDRLTLVSQFDPDSRWLVYNAMDRNKLLYGLSDAALVVASAADTGGTWAGATEALKADRINVYIKSTGTLAPGNSKLFSKRGLPFPAPPWEDLRSWLTAPHEKTGYPDCEEAADIAATAESAVISAETPPIREAYTLVIDELLSILQKPRSEKELIGGMNVLAPQMKDWLARAVFEGRIEKLKKPVRYVAAPLKLPLSE
jgi:predicted Rossmann fold nucleotide-binding protein DprA/Smf involved in DNA uptake